MTNSPDPVENRDVADAKAWFYLDHRADIETWVGLRKEARLLVDRHLLEIEEVVAGWTGELGAELLLQNLEDGAIPRIGLFRPSWTHDGIPVLSINFEWDRSRLLTPGSNEWPYVAIRVTGGDDATERRVLEASRDVKKLLRWEGSPPGLPCWIYIRPPASSSVEPAALVDAGASRLRDLWETAAPLLDAAFI